MKTRPEHARNFPGKAKNIPEQDLFMLPYQSRWIEDQSILMLMEKSRRIGISYASSYKIVREHSRATRTQDTWVSSRDETTARLFVADCKGFCRILKTAAEDIGKRLVEKESVYALSFANGTDLNSVASNPDVFAGKGGDVVLDEFALRSDPRGVYAIASPTIDWGGSMFIISTHRGSKNFFNELCEEAKHKGNPKGFSHHRVTLEDALNQGFLWKLQSKIAKSKPNDPRLDMDEADYFNYQKSRAADDETFLQEYMCVPSDDNSAFLSYDLIATCELRHPDTMTVDTEETRDFSGRKGSIRTLRLYDDATIARLPGELFVGVDIGRVHDLTVIWVYCRMMGVLMPVAIIEMASVEFARQEAELYRYLPMRTMRRCCIDQTGIGRQFTERAQIKFGKYRVEGIAFTSMAKEEMAYPVRAAFEDRSLRVPSDDKMVADLRAIKKISTAGDNVRFAADRGANGHADRFWALALAVHASKSVESGPTWAHSVPSAGITDNLTAWGGSIPYGAY